MPTVIEMEDLFKTYFAEMEKCRAHGCFWALLHLVIVMPDIYSALETPSGEATGRTYRQWAKRYLEPEEPNLMAREWWDVRCALLHQGRTRAPSGRYLNYTYGRPGPRGESDHGKVVNRVLHLDVARLECAIRTGMACWFADVAQRPSRAGRSTSRPTSTTSRARCRPSVRCHDPSRPSSS